MRTGTRAVPAAMGALALALALTGCNDSDAEKSRGNSGSASSDSDSAASDEKKTFRLGETGSEQESDMQKSAGAKYTVTPTEVHTKADMDNSGLEKDKESGPQVPVYVWSTLTHTSGTAMEVGDMDDDLVVKTDKGRRTRALLVLGRHGPTARSRRRTRS